MSNALLTLLTFLLKEVMLCPLWMKCAHTYTQAGFSAWLSSSHILTFYSHRTRIRQHTRHKHKRHHGPRTTFPAARVPLKIMRRFVQVTLAIKDEDDSHTRFSQWQGGVHTWFTRNHFSHSIRCRYSAARKDLKIHRCTENEESVRSYRKMFP